MTTEALELNENSADEISVLEKEVLDLQDTINNPEKHGIFDELAKTRLRERLHAKQEELSLKRIENID